MEFVIEVVVSDIANKDRMKHLIREDQGFRRALIGDDRLFQKVSDDDEVFVRISPTLYFEILLRRVLKNLGTSTHTLEREGMGIIPIFDSPQVVKILDDEGVLEYLAQMLASFTQLRNYVAPVHVRRGVGRMVRYNDMDIDSIVLMCDVVLEQERLGIYSRIADVCLF